MWFFTVILRYVGMTEKLAFILRWNLFAIVFNNDIFRTASNENFSSEFGA